MKVVWGLLLALVVLAGAGVALSWAPDRSVDSLKARWAQPPSQFVDADGLSVHVRDEGPRNDPAPIVLLHGTSSSLHTWDGWAAELSRTRRVIRMDMPGFGLTGPAADDSYRIEDYVGFVTAVLDRLGVKHCVLGGNSLGGEVAWETALANPARVDKLILVDAGGYVVPNQSMPIGFRLAKIPALAPLVEHLLPRAMIRRSVEEVYGDPAKVTPELVDRYYELTLRAGNRHALVQRFAQHVVGADQGKIASLSVPTLIIWGGKDKLFTPETAERFHKDIAGSWIAMFDHAGHVPQEEDPAHTVEAVKQFLGMR